MVSESLSTAQLLSLLTMSGAIVGYLTKLGIALPAVGDNGELFALAVIVFVSCAAILVLHRTEIPLPASRRHA